MIRSVIRLVGKTAKCFPGKGSGEGLRTERGFRPEMEPLTFHALPFVGPSFLPAPLEYRFLPSEFVFPSTTAVYEDKVFIIMWSAQPIGILIRGKEISDSYRKFFEILWKSSK